jgi:hypothetical protein
LLILILPISAIYFLYIEVTNKKGVIWLVEKNSKHIAD